MLRRISVIVLAVVVALLGVPSVPSYADDPPTLTLTVDRSVYTYGQTVRFTATIHAMNLTYLLQVRYPGQSTWHQVEYAGNVNDDVIRTSLGAYYNMQVRGLLIDTKNTEDTADDTLEASVTRGIGVRATVRTHPNGYFTKVRGYAVMSKYSAKFGSISAPAFPGQRCLRHQVQRKYGSRWRTVKTSACIREGKQGRVNWRWGGSHPSKVKFRVRATFAGDQVNRPNRARWLYFRFR